VSIFFLCSKKCNNLDDLHIDYECHWLHEYVFTTIFELNRLKKLWLKFTDFRGFDIACLKPISCSSLKELVFVCDEYNSSTYHDSAFKSTLKYICKLALEVVHVDFYEVTDDAMHLLCSITTLQKLHIIHSQITNAALKYLNNLKYIKELSIHKSWHAFGDKGGIDNEGLAYISPLISLRRLSLHSLESITSSGLVHLSNLRNLVELDLYSTKIDEGDGSLQHLSPLVSLRCFTVSFTNVTPSEMIHLGCLENLTELNAYYCQLLGHDLSFLSKLTSLLKLNLSFCRVDDKNMHYIGDIVSLQHLNLSENDISDEGVKALRNLSHLLELNLTNCRLIGEEGLTFLALSLQSLQTLILTKTGLIDRLIKKLQNSFRKVTIIK